MIAAALGAAAGACSLINDDLAECPARLQLQFVYTYNLENADAFSAQVENINVWAFDHSTGECVWTGSDSGEALKRPGYTLVTPLGAGTYDFIVWAGLKDNADFDLATYTPSSKEELEVTLATVATDGLNVSSSHFSRLFHGMSMGVNHTINPQAPSITTQVVPLMKDTKDIAVMIHNINGTAIKDTDFKVEITYADSRLAWNNDVMTSSIPVTYRPWSILYGESTSGMGRATADDLDHPEKATLLFELSTSRLMQSGDAILDIYRTCDGERIVHCNIIEYFLLEKGARHSHYADQEYLDRRSDYSVLFFVDKNLDLYTAMGIYINGWALVPPQEDEL